MLCRIFFTNVNFNANLTTILRFLYLYKANRHKPTFAKSSDFKFFIFLF